MSLVFKYKLFPIFMGMTSVLLAICVVIQNIGIAEFFESSLVPQGFSYLSIVIYYFNRINFESNV